MGPNGKKTIRTFAQRKTDRERLALVTAYDYPMARLADEADVDGILVGDTLGMVVLGYDTTLPVTMDEMLHHVKAVTRARPRALVIADLPFLSYQAGDDEGVRNAGRMLKEGGADVVKIEGGERVVPLVRRLVSAGIPVMGHLGMTPQSVRQFGSFRLQGKSPDDAGRLLDEARMLAEAGCFAIVLELIPAELAAQITAAIPVPTIGIGAGPDCDGEVQVINDLLGLFEWFVPRHTRQYAQLAQTAQTALKQYVDDVRAGRFPAEENTFHAPELAEAGVVGGASGKEPRSTK